MSIRTTVSPVFPKAPDFSGMDEQQMQKAMNTYVQAVNRTLRRMVDDVYHDLKRGQATHDIYAARPTSAQMDVGQVALYTSAAKFYLGARISGYIRVRALSTTG